MAQLELLLLVPRGRPDFSVSVKDVQLEGGSPPGGYAGAAGWRAVTRVLRSTSVAARGTVADLVNAVFPSECRVCGAPVMELDGARVCGACVERVGPQVETMCARCGDALGMESARFAAAMGVTECTPCRAVPPEFARAVAYGVFDEELREMIHLLKFGKRRSLAERPLGEWLARAVLQLEADAASELVAIPVPLFPAWERIRGFNQSALLAQGALRSLRQQRPAWKLALNERALERVKDTERMYQLNPSQRRKNLRGAFRVADPAAIRGREVLLLDDIMTTGATARECSRILARAGAAKVWVATVAKAQPEGVAGLASHQDVALWDAATPHPTEFQARGLQQPDPGRRISF